MSNLISLPHDVLFSMLGKFELDQLGKICASSKEIKEICDSYDFWNRKYFDEFEEYLPENEASNWKKVYLKNKLIQLKKRFNVFNTEMWNSISSEINSTFQNEPEIETIHDDFCDNLTISYFKVDYGDSKKPWIDKLIKRIVNNDFDEDYLDYVISDAIRTHNVSSVSLISAENALNVIKNQIQSFKQTSMPLIREIQEFEKRLM